MAEPEITAPTSSTTSAAATECHGTATDTAATLGSAATVTYSPIPVGTIPPLERIFGPWRTEELNAEQLEYQGEHAEWPYPPHVLHYGFPIDRPARFIGDKARELCANTRGWDEVLEFADSDPDLFDLCALDHLRDLICDRYSFDPSLSLEVCDRVGMAEGSVGMIALWSNDHPFKDRRQLRERTLRAIRTIFEIPQDIKPMWYYDRWYLRAVEERFEWVETSAAMQLRPEARRSHRRLHARYAQ